MATKLDALPFDLRALEIFLAVCDAGGMAAAARLLGLTQPAVSQTIGDIEARAGTTLFDRSVRPLGLTPAGGLLRQRAAALLIDARQIGLMLKETERGKLALVRLGLVDSLSRALSTPLATFLRERADAVQVLSGLTATHAGALLTRNLDLFIGVDDMGEVAGLERFELMREPYILLMPEGVKAPATLAEWKELIRRVPFVRYSARSKTGQEIERHLKRLGLEIAPSHEFDTPQGVTGLVMAGEGFAITTPLCLAEANVGSNDITPAPLPGPKLSRTLTLIARRQELGTLPRDVANTCRSRLDREILPGLRKRMPWLGEEMGVPP